MDRGPLIKHLWKNALYYPSADAQAFSGFFYECENFLMYCVDKNAFTVLLGIERHLRLQTLYESF